MFTGIIEEVGKVISTSPGRLSVAARAVLEGTRQGDSVAVNGVCLTATHIGDSSLSFDVMEETLRRSNLGVLRAGDKVNLERPMALGGRLGGHLVQGHIDGTGRVISTIPEGTAMLVRFEAPPEVMRYIVEKGFIGVDGVSLTVVRCDSRSFVVSLVEYTRSHTNLGARRTGDLVNLEVDIIAKYVEQFSRAQPGLSLDFLKEHGFTVS